jgi:hypothetical protein
MLMTSLNNNALLHKQRPVVYISGPLSVDGEWLSNIHKAGKVYIELIEYGFAPICPHLHALGQLVDPAIGDHDYEVWMSVDCSLIGVCDAVLRMPGPSKGGDVEVSHALDLMIPVFIDVDAMVEYFFDRLSV